MIYGSVVVASLSLVSAYHMRTEMLQFMMGLGSVFVADNLARHITQLLEFIEKN